MDAKEFKKTVMMPQMSKDLETKIIVYEVTLKSNNIKKIRKALEGLIDLEFDNLGTMCVSEKYNTGVLKLEARNC